MKDDIKEILDNLKYTAKKHTIQVLENGGKIEHCPQEIETELRLNTYSANILLDYITNLQEEIQKKEAMYDSLAVSYRLEQEENERLHNIIKEVREYIENNSYFKDNVVKTMIFKDYSNGILEILDKPISKKPDNDF